MVEKTLKIPNKITILGEDYELRQVKDLKNRKGEQTHAHINHIFKIISLDKERCSLPILIHELGHIFNRIMNLKYIVNDSEAVADAYSMFTTQIIYQMLFWEVEKVKKKQSKKTKEVKK